MQSLLLSTVASKSITSWRHLKAIGAVGIFAGVMTVEPMVSVQVRSVCMTSEYVKAAPSAPYCTLYTVVYAVSISSATDQPLGSSVVFTLSLSPKCFPLETGAFAYTDIGRDMCSGSTFNVANGIENLSALS